MMKKMSIASMLLAANTSFAYADDQGVLTFTTSTTTINQRAVFAQLSREQRDRRDPNNIGAFFIKDFYAASPPVTIDATSTGSSVIKEYRRGGGGAAARVIGGAFSGALEQQILVRGADRIIEDNR